MGPLRAGVHILCVVAMRELAMVMTAIAGCSGVARPSPKDHRRCRTIELWNCHHDGALNWEQPTRGISPLIKGLKLQRMRRDIGHIKPRQNLLSGTGVVVGGAAHQ